MTRRISALDPRAGIWLLLLANIGMFCEKYAWQNTALSVMFLLFLLLYRQYSAVWKGALLIVVFRLLLKFVFPLCPHIINMVFPVLINYTLRMMPCILAGILLVRNASMQKMIAVMRALHLPQGFITAISTTPDISRRSRMSSGISERRQSCKTSPCPKGWNPQSCRL